jgi:molybdopterin molybdotransferase
MAPSPEHRQRITRLTPVEDLLRHIDGGVRPVEAREVPIAQASGALLARDIVLAEARPPTPLAMIDGWAVRAEATADAGGYAPVLLPHTHEVEVGDALPPEFDAVAPHDIVTRRREACELHQPVTAGDGVLMPGDDAAAGEVLRPAGARLRHIDVATLRALGVATVRLRKPRLRICRARKARDAIGEAAALWLADAIAKEGGDPLGADDGAASPPLEALVGGHGVTPIESIIDDVDGAIIVGGTGSGRRDHAIEALARAGTVMAHGIAMTPGESAAFGFVRSRPVLLVPGRLDVAVAAWLLIGRVMLARLQGGDDDVSAAEGTLTAKVTSTIGLTELVPVRWSDGGVEPLASKYLPLTVLCRADGWIVIPAASEGLPAGARVMVKPLI